MENKLRSKSEFVARADLRTMLLTSACTVLVTTFISTGFNRGFSSGFVVRWLQTFGLAYPCVAPIMCILMPRLRRWLRR